MYIVFEGIDGAGKSTQIQLLKEWLEDNGLEVETMVEPTDSEVGKLIRKILQRPDATTDRVQKTLGLLFAADRMLIMDKLEDKSKIFISDCMVFFDTIATFVQTIAGWVVLTGKNVAQISNGISNPFVAGIGYWLIRILVCGGCLVGTGILIAFIGIKIAGLYKKYCWDMITIMVILISMAIAIYFGDWIKTALPINLLFLLLFVQLAYVGIRWYVKGWRETRGYS